MPAKRKASDDLKSPKPKRAGRAKAAGSGLLSPIAPVGSVGSRPAATGPKRTGPRNVKQPVTEENEWVIKTRDNFKPDASGLVSITEGKLPWEEVAVLFGERYGGTHQWPAMEKRNRTMRPRYLEEHPEYPREIVYAPKTKATLQAPKAKRPAKASKTERVSRKADEKLLEQLKSLVRGPCWTREFWNAYGRMRVFPDARKAAQPEHYFRPELVDIVLVESNQQRMAARAVPSEHLQRSSALAAGVLLDPDVSELKIRVGSVRAIERYIQCISPVQLSELPTHDFFVKPRKDEQTFGSSAAVATIDWTIRDLADLYAVAACLEDDRVRNLVVDRWAKIVQDLDEFLVNDLNYLWDTVEDDPARRLWIDMLYHRNVEIQSEVPLPNDLVAEDVLPETLIRMLDRKNKTSRFTKESCPWTVCREIFCEKYHSHPDPCGPCKPTMKTTPELIDFFAIAHRFTRDIHDKQQLMSELKRQYCQNLPPELSAFYESDDKCSDVESEAGGEIETHEDAESDDGESSGSDDE